MKKFPNPSRIRLLIKDYGRLPHTTNERNQEYTTSVLHFLEYLCKIQDCSVSNILFVENAPSLIKDLLSSISLQTKIKLPQICIVGDDYKTHENSLNKTHGGIENNVVDGKHTISIVFDKKIAAEFEQQLLNLFKEAGFFFTEVVLHINKGGELIPGLNHIGNYCHKLEELKILPKCPVIDHLLAFEEIPNEVINYSVKELSISGFDLNSNLLYSISAHFPCLENLIINGHLAPSHSRDYKIIDDKKNP